MASYPVRPSNQRLAPGSTRFQDRELRRHALSDAGDLVELVCQELRCRKLDHDTAVLLDRANLFL